MSWLQKGQDGLVVNKKSSFLLTLLIAPDISF